MLVHDAGCVFCRWCAAWVAARADVTVVAASEVDSAEWGLSDHELHAAAWWLDGDARLRGHRAVARALIAVGGPWRVVGRLLGVPPVSWAAAGAYRAVAANRQRLSRVLPSRQPAR